MHSHLEPAVATEGTKTSLNPCFNGRCTRTTGPEEYRYNFSIVLILVLMEDALALFDDAQIFENACVS